MPPATVPQYARNRMDAYTTTRTFALGNTGITLPRGQEILFDGNTADIGGESMPAPTLRGAVKAGWMVLTNVYDEDDNSAEIPQAAGIEMRHATQGGNPMDQRSQPKRVASTVADDEREVGNVRAHAKNARDANQQYRRGQPVNSGQVESQDGVTVRRLKTLSGERAKNARTVLTAGSVGQALADTRVTIEPGVGMTEEQMLERMPQEEAEEYLAQKASRRAQYVDEEAPKVVNRVASKGREVREGISSQLTTGGGIETGDLSGLDPGKPKKATVVREGITFQVTNGGEEKDQAHPRQADTSRQAPAVVVKQASPDVRRMVAKQLCKDFPDNYDFAAADKKKLARLQADYEERPDVLRAVFAAEGDAFKQLLMDEFPQAFAS